MIGGLGVGLTMACCWVPITVTKLFLRALLLLTTTQMIIIIILNRYYTTQTTVIIGPTITPIAIVVELS